MRWLFVFCLMLLPVLGYAQSESVLIDALVPGCGNLVVETGEACDGTNLSGQSCSTIGFSSGALACSSSCTFVTASCVVAPPVPATSGGGSATRIRSVTGNAVVLEGTASPQAVVWLLRDGVRIASTVSNATGQFSFSLPAFALRTYTMSLYTEARDGLRSSAFTFPLSATRQGTTKYETFSLGPTIDISHTSVVRGRGLDVYGESTPDSVVVVVVYADGKALFQTTGRTSTTGRYSLLIPTDQLAPGNYTVLSYTVKDMRVSAPSRVIAVSVGDSTIPRYRDFDICPFIRGDVNRDCRVDMRDVLLARQWQEGRGSSGLTELERLSGDGRITMKDFSIIMYNWTG